MWMDDFTPVARHDLHANAFAARPLVPPSPTAALRHGTAPVLLPTHTQLHGCAAGLRAMWMGDFTTAHRHELHANGFHTARLGAAQLHGGTTQSTGDVVVTVMPLRQGARTVSSRMPRKINGQRRRTWPHAK